MMLKKSMNYAAIGLLSATVSMTALAATPEATAPLTNSEATFAFADPAATTNLVAMDKQEMKDTEGAWIQYVVIGAAVAVYVALRPTPVY